MFRIQLQNLFYEFKDFVKANVGKCLIAVLLFLLSMALGIRNAFHVADAQNYLLIHKSGTTLLIIGDKSAFGFFLSRLLTYVCIVALLTLLSYHLYLSTAGFAILFCYNYVCTLYFCLYIMTFKIVILPFALLCLLPCCLLAYLLLTFYVVLACNRGREIKLYGIGARCSLLGFLRTAAPVLITLGILSILEAVLAFFLTIGIV